MHRVACKINHNGNGVMGEKYTYGFIVIYISVSHAGWILNVSSLLHLYTFNKIPKITFKIFIQLLSTFFLFKKLQICVTSYCIPVIF